MGTQRALRVGLGYRGKGRTYDNYEIAAHSAAGALGADADVAWLATTASAPEAIPPFDALVLTGGDDVDPARYGARDSSGLCEVDPARDATEWRVLETALERCVPILAICRGAQLLNVYFGGTLLMDLGAKNAAHRAGVEGDRRHAVDLTPSTLLSQTGAPLRRIVNSSHHQAVDRLATPFRPAAFSADGVLEAFEWADPRRPWMLAVQWHPERMGDPASTLGDELFRRLLTAAHTKSS